MRRYRAVDQREARRPFARGLRRAVAGLAIITAALGADSLAPSEARADGLADESELHFQLGAAAYGKGEFTDALVHFHLSNRLVPNRRVVYNIARSYEQLHQFADAHRYFVDALAGETDAEVIKNLKAAIDRVAPNVAILDV